MGDALSHRAKRLAVVAILFATTACASLGASSSDDTSQHVDRLYFGLGIRDTGMVSDSAWAAFVRDVVTPRFPQGFSVFRGDGQWRYANGNIAKEPTMVLELIHVPDATTEARVAEIAEHYRKQFDQEAVARVISAARVIFYTP